MAYSSKHLLFTAHGSLPSGEVWSCGIRAKHATLSNVGVPQADLNLMAVQFADKFKAMVDAISTGAVSLWGLGTTFDGVTGRVITSAGITETLTERSPTTAIVAPTAANKLPTQCAVVVTLLTADPSRQGKGRIYLPLLGLSVNANGRIPNPSTVASNFVTFVTAVHTAWAAVSPWRLAVASQGGNSGTPKIQDIVGIRVGDIVDTQRRRRDSIAEAYSSGVIAA